MPGPIPHSCVHRTTIVVHANMLVQFKLDLFVESLDQILHGSTALEEAVQSRSGRLWQDPFARVNNLLVFLMSLSNITKEDRAHDGSVSETERLRTALLRRL